jgi:nucleotide-binding universal stress UspA family protein
MRLVKEPIEIHQILVPVKKITPQAILTIEFAQLFAETNEAAITLLHICDRKTDSEELTTIETQLQNVVKSLQSPIDITIRVIRQDSVAEVIIAQAQNCDLVILRSVRRRTAGGLAVSDISDRIVRQLHCSLILFGEPHS